MMRYLIKIYRQGKSYSAMAPDLPGCVAAGDSVEEVRKLMAEAMALHIDLMRQSGEKIPAPAKQVRLDVESLEEDELCTWVEVKKPRIVVKS